jgi:WhiB family redox-sensing transcriptional regulator
MTTLHTLAANTPGLPCTTTNPDLWFSRRPDERALAVALCQECPLRRPCVQYAIDHPVQGVWGGTTISSDLRQRLRGKPWQFDAQGRARLLCGSEDAYRSHLGYREQPCEECTAAHEVHQEAERRARLEAEHAAGGSPNGYHLHRRLGEAACALCLEALRRQSAAARRARAGRRLQRPRTPSEAWRATGALSGPQTGTQPLPIAS